MTTEDDFQAALDRHPKDYQTRLVFADWLDDHGDPRAEGYRALGTLRLFPDHYAQAPTKPFSWIELDAGKPYGSHLPFTWTVSLSAARQYPNVGFGFRYSANYASRKEADDDAALTFGRLAPHLKARYLKS